MKNELNQKKEYFAPEMELIEMKSSRALLEDSCPDCEEFPLCDNPKGC